MENKYYKPLPSYLTIKPSPIEGLGLFATEFIPNGKVFGITHVKDKRFPDGYIRTALGSFFNHSENPNCKLIHTRDFILIESLMDIQPSEEITALYTLYDPTK